MNRCFGKLFALLLSCLIAGIFAIQLAHAQGRPDMVWMKAGYPWNIYAAVYSPDGKLLAIIQRYNPGSPYHCSIAIFRVSDGALLKTIVTKPENSGGYAVNGLAFSADGKMLAGGCTDNTLRIWNMTDYTPQYSLTGYSDGVYTPAFSPDGSMIAAGSQDFTVRIFRLPTGSLMRTLIGHTSGVSGVSFSADGQKFVSAASEVIVRSTSNWQETYRISQGASQPLFSPDNQYLTFSTGTNIYVCNASSGLYLRSVGPANSYSFTPDGQGVIGCQENYTSHVKSWRLSDGQLLLDFEGDSPNLVAYSPDGQTIATTYNISYTGYILLRRASDGAVIRSLYAHNTNISSLAMTPTGDTFATTDYSGKINVWKTADGSLTRTLKHSSAIYSSALSPDGQYFAAGDGNRRLQLWQLPSWTSAGSLPAYADGVLSVAFSPDGRFVASGDASGVHFWQLSTFLDCPLQNNGIYATAIAFSPDGNTFAAVGSGTLAFWNTTTCTRIRTLTIPNDGAYPQSLVFSPDGQTVAVAKNTDGWSVQLYRVSDGSLIKEFVTQQSGIERINGLAFSPDGQTLAGGSNGKISIWLVQNGLLLTTYDQECSVNKLAYSPDGKYLVCGRTEGTAWVALNPYRNAIFPNHGGNTGNVTFKIITPVNFAVANGATVKLIASGQPDIVPQNLMWINTHLLQGTFNLNGAALGMRDVVITNTDGTTRTFPMGFKVEQGVAPQTSVSITGYSKARGNIQQPYTAFIANTGNVDAENVTVWVEFPSYIDFTSDMTPRTVDNAQDGTTRVTFSLPSLPVNGQAVPLRLKAPNGSQYAHTVFNFCTSSNTEDQIQLLLYLNGIDVKQNYPDTQVGGLLDCTIQGLLTFNNEYQAYLAANHKTGRLKITGGSESGFHQETSGRTHQRGYKVDLIDTVDFDNLSNFVRSIGTEVNPPTFGEEQWISNAGGAVFTREDPPLHWDVDFHNFGGACGSGTGGYGSNQQCIPVEIITSGDPNYLAGPQGFGTPGWVGNNAPLQYTVSFSNEPDASAPAAQVFVNQTLDAANLDMTTFRLGTIAFGDWSVTPTDDVALPLVNHPFDTDVDLRTATPSRNLIVHVHAQIDILTGNLSVSLISIDPLTGLPTTDPTAGFLDAGKEGSVSFSVVPKSTVLTGTVTKEQATVIFDANAPMDTPIWMNTLDNDAPMSAVTMLPAQSASSFIVKWAGTDTIANVTGSGLRDFTVYVSDNGGAFTLWLTNTTDTQATYVGMTGHTYAFYSQARDNAYNLEPLHTQADAMTTVVLSVSGTIMLQGCTNMAQTLTFAFRPTDGSGSFTRTVTPNADGTFQFLNIPANSYNVAIKGAIWLQKVVAVDTTNGPVSGVTATLLGGDADNNNIVDVGDFGIVVNAYLGVASDPTSGYDASADFNCDGVVDIGDFGILVGNFLSAGDP